MLVLTLLACTKSTTDTDSGSSTDSEPEVLTCDDGYVVSGDECVDVDECAEALADCDDNATCTNTDGAFECACVDGYTGDGVDCADIDECAEELDDCGELADCTNTDGAFECACVDGYAGDGIECLDVDECADELDDCPEQSDCINTDGAFECDCHEGTYGDDCGPLWEELAVFPDLSLTTSWSTSAAAIGETLYFAPDHGDAFYSIDLATLTLDTEESSYDFCACGYTEVLVELDGALYMFGNRGAVFDGTSWSDAAYPSSNPDRRRGEAAGVASGGKVWVMGGRGDLATVQTYSGGENGTWADEADLPWGVRNAVAYSPVGSDAIYLFGGSDSNGYVVRAAAMDPVNGWAEIATPPTSFYSSSGTAGAAEFDGRLVLSRGAELYVYDPGADTWWSDPLPMPDGASHVLIAVGTQPYVLSQRGADVVLSKLHDIE